MSSIVAPARKLRELLQDPRNIVVAPGVYDGISARMAISLGFDAIYMTGAGTSMSRLGWADLGMATQQDMAGNASMLASLSATPLIADADTGYGGPIMVTRTVRAYAQAGVAALHLEDQVQEKRCGHLLGKEVVTRDVFYARLRAAIIARDEMGSDMMIIARTDSRQTDGFDETVARLRGAIELGVDAVFPEGLTSIDECKKMVEAMSDTPVLLNMVSGGVTPDLTVEEAKEIGFRVIIFPAVSIGAAINAYQDALSKLKEEGKEPRNPAGMGPKEAFMLCGLRECMELDKKAGGKAFNSV